MSNRVRTAVAVLLAASLAVVAVAGPAAAHVNPKSDDGCPEGATPHAHSDCVSISFGGTAGTTGGLLGDLADAMDLGL